MRAPVDLNPATAVYRLGRRQGERIAIRYGKRSISYAELADITSRTAALLAASGVRSGDRVAYLGLNSPAFLTTFLAATWLGAVFVPVNFRYSPAEVRVLIDDCSPHTIIVEPGHLSVLDPSGASTPRILVVDDDPAASLDGRPPDGARSLSTQLDACSRTVPVARHEGDLAVLMYTSGTTGRAKGVMLTHGNLWWNAVNVDAVMDTRRDDVNLAVAPLFHIGGLNAFTLRSLTRGATIVVHRSFDAATVLRDLVEYGVTSLFAVPSMYAALTRVPGFTGTDFSALRAPVVAGAPVPPGLVIAYGKQGIRLQQAWGLTETAPFVTVVPAELTAQKPSSAGLPMPYTEIRVVDTVTGEPLVEPDMAGELWVRGPNVASGYWANADATAAAFDEAGWFHTGDLGRLDADGHLHIVDRLKDMIITGGENVYPAELENVLIEFPGVLDVAVVGAADPVWGESVVAVLVCATPVTPTAEEIGAFAAEHLARYKRPRGVLRMDALPRNGSGKVDKVAVRRLVSQAFPPALDAR